MKYSHLILFSMTSNRHIINRRLLKAARIYVRLTIIIILYNSQKWFLIPSVPSKILGNKLMQKFLLWWKLSMSFYGNIQTISIKRIILRFLFSRNETNYYWRSKKLNFSLQTTSLDIATQCRFGCTEHHVPNGKL